MRIIGGKYRGRRISPPAGLDVRPTTDFAKEALFNILQHRHPVSGLHVLELFSGTGNVTLEFASHGAASVHAVEKDPRRKAFIEKTALQLGIENIRVVRQDVKTYLKTAAGKFGIVFADPPYDLAWLPEIPAMVFDQALLEPEGWLIVEHGPRTDLSGQPHFLEKRTYGNVNFSIFQAP